MAKVMNWKAPEIFNEINDRCLDNANKFMDVVVLEAKRKCPIDTKTFREGKFSNAAVSFTPRTGKNKGKLVTFNTSKRWLGRYPGNLRNTVRRVNRTGSGNIRVYAGDYKIYWAFMIERGYHDRSGKHHAGIHFMRNSFASMGLEVKKAFYA
jgi:hypothetical protein